MVLMPTNTPEQQHNSFGGFVLVVAAIAIVVGAIHLASAIVTPVFLAIVVTLIVWPLYVWLRSRNLGTLPALILLFVGIVIGSVLIAGLVAYSMIGLADRLSLYSDQFSSQLQSVDGWLQGHGLPGVNLATLVTPEAVSTAFGVLVAALLEGLKQAAIILFLLLFFVVEGPALMTRLQAGLAHDDPNRARLSAFGHDVGQYFILRAAVNAVTGAGVALVLWLLGVDFPLLWGVLTFFLSFIPYVGMFVASVPSVLLAWAEFDLVHGIVVALALTLVNATAENLVQPALMHRGLGLSATFVFVSVFFWSSVLGGGGSFLAVPLSVALLTVLANYPAATWFVNAAATRRSDVGKADESAIGSD